MRKTGAREKVVIQLQVEMDFTSLAKAKVT